MNSRTAHKKPVQVTCGLQLVSLKVSSNSNWIIYRSMPDLIGYFNGARVSLINQLQSPATAKREQGHEIIYSVIGSVT